MQARILACLIFASGAALAECERPYPVTIPADPPAEKDVMMEIQGQVKTYLSEADEYLKCNEGEQARLASELQENTGGADDIQVQIKILLTRYNNTVDEMHVVGDRYNALVRSYNAQAEPN
ncbi:MAG: hypothetical protein AAGE01_08760 [Pseudomonadota bacterium]